MTLLGAVVFGGLLGIAVLWLLVTAPDNEVEDLWDHAQRQEASKLASVSAGSAESIPWAASHSSQK